MQLVKFKDNMLATDSEPNLTYRRLNWAYQIKTVLSDVGMLNI